VIQLIEAGLDDPKSIIMNYCALPTDVREGFGDEGTGAELQAALRAYQDQIVPLLMGRTNILKANNVYVQDAAAYLDRIDTLLSQEMRSLFLGSKSAKTVWKGTLDTVLDGAQKPPQPVPLIRVDPQRGVCSVAPLAPTSKPIPTDILTNCSGDALNTAVMNVAYHPDQASQVFSIVQNGVTEAADRDVGFRYRVPAQVRVEVKDASAISHPELIPGQTQPSVEVYGSAVLSIAQLGHVAKLPANLHGKELMFDLAFIEATGGLRSFKLNSTGGFDATGLDSLSTTTTGLLDARKAAKDAAAAAADELALLQRRAAILTAQKEICDVLTAFNLPCEFAPQAAGPPN
jgi:hypothetical protein